METPPATAPLHRYVSLHGASTGATLFSDGLAEYEADPSGGVSVTLLRSMGELSRADLPERPGHAGWPTSVPEAQCPGPFGAELALLLHGACSAETIDLIERAADDVLLPLTGATLRSALRNPGAVPGVALEGDGTRLLVREGKRGRAVDGAALRQPARRSLQRVRGGSARAVREAHVARLDETIVEPAQVGGRCVRFRAGPRAVVTVLVR